MELDCTTDIASGLTLVSVRLRNERAVPRRVRLRNRLDGAVLPPRCQGEPEAGWDIDGVTRVIGSGETLALGYASPASPRDPPVELVDVGPPDESAPEPEPVGEAIRQLGDARPPRAVLSAGPEPRVSEPAEEPTIDDGCQETVVAPERWSGGTTDTDGSPGTGDLPSSGCDLPFGAGELLDPYRRRVETVEALAVASVPEATAILDANGGIDGVEGTGAELVSDAAELRALAVEATALAARATAATPPTELLRRLS